MRSSTVSLRRAPSSPGRRLGAFPLDPRDGRLGFFIFPKAWIGPTILMGHAAIQVERFPGSSPRLVFLREKDRRLERVRRVARVGTARHDTLQERQGTIAIPGREMDGVHFAMDFLPQQNRRVSGEPVPAGDPPPILATDKHVVVIGGGDTGSDCIGTCHRQGAVQVRQVELLGEPPASRDASTP